MVAWPYTLIKWTEGINIFPVYVEIYNTHLTFSKKKKKKKKKNRVTHIYIIYRITYIQLCCRKNRKKNSFGSQKILKVDSDAPVPRRNAYMLSNGNFNFDFAHKMYGDPLWKNMMIFSCPWANELAQNGLYFSVLFLC
jgi:hypothetical protein